MAKIFLSKDLSRSLSSLDKGFLEIVTCRNGLSEALITSFDIREFKEEGIKLELSFRGDGEVHMPKVILPIISIEGSDLDSGKKVTLRLRCQDSSSVKVLIESADDMFLTNAELISKESFFLLQRDAPHDLNKVYTVEMEKSGGVLEDENSNSEKLSVIEGRISYIEGNGERLPRNLCLNGIKVKLYNEDNRLMTSRITRRYGRENGYFKFTGILKGSYKIRFLVPYNLQIVKGSAINIVEDSAIISFSGEDKKYIDIGVVNRA